MSLWQGTYNRGPAEAASTSGRCAVSRVCRSAAPSRRHTYRPRPSTAQPFAGFQQDSPHSYAASSNGTLAISYKRSGDATTASSAPQEKGRQMTVSYDEATADDIFVPAPPRGSKTLKINVDLMLWRARQARVAARMSLNAEQRRTLLREAEDGLRRCLALDPNDPRTYVVLGKVLMVQKRYDEARTLYTEGCTATGNTNPYIWAAWGWLEFKTGNVARARKLFDAATVVDETHACAWHKWGMLEKSQGNYLRARDLFMQGIQKCRRKPQSQNAYLYNALAVMAAKLGRVQEARAWFEEGTRSLEGAASVALWQAWAVLEAKAGDPTAVRYLFKKALAANPRSRYVHLAWALWERKAGNTALCTELLRRGSALNPTDAALYQASALVAWRDRGDVEGARRAFEAGVAADPSHLYLWQAWGCMEARLGNVERARALFQEGVWADPSSRDTVYVLHAWGCLEAREGKLPLARELLKAAIRVDPKSEKVWCTWVAMEADAGHLERAEELRIRQAEQAWEFEVPAGFTTRPGSAPSALGLLTDTLTRFFSARDAHTSAASDGRAAPGGSRGGVRDYLPADFDGELGLEEVLRASGAGGGAGGDAGQAGADAAAAAFGSVALAGVGSELMGDAGRPGGKGPNSGDGAGLLPASDVSGVLQVLSAGGEVEEVGKAAVAAAAAAAAAAASKGSAQRSRPFYSDLSAMGGVELAQRPVRVQRQAARTAPAQDPAEAKSV